MNESVQVKKETLWVVGFVLFAFLEAGAFFLMDRHFDHQYEDMIHQQSAVIAAQQNRIQQDESTMQTALDKIRYNCPQPQ